MRTNWGLFSLNVQTVVCIKSNCEITDVFWKTLKSTFALFSLVREKKDLPLDPVDQKDQDGSFDYQ